MKKYIFLVSLLFSSLVFAVDVPNSKVTPGDTFPGLALDKLCVSGYTSTVRNVTTAEKKKVLALYGLTRSRDGYCSGPQGCEIDHLISLELGGSNDVKNLWPQPYDGTWNARMKDRLENTMHKLVCTKKITLKQAQTEISKDWKSAYKKYVK